MKPDDRAFGRNGMDGYIVGELSWSRVTALRERLHELPEPVGKVGRARRQTRMGHDGLVRLCAKAAPRLFRQRRPPMMDGGRLVELRRDWGSN
jgi:hypothetical protein